ncbi:MAG: hypothetical protein IJI60_00970 [Bacilli bacterium]|nr:hypothetical protein [Bacilli bacterium]
MTKLDRLDRIALTVYGAKNSNGVEYLEDGADYAFSILDEKEGILTVLVEEPVYSSRKWTVARKIFEIGKDGNISEKESLEKEDRYSFTDLTDEEFLKRRVYNFIKDHSTLYIERKQPVMDTKRKIEKTKILYDYKKKEIEIAYQGTELLSDAEPVIKFEYPRSRYQYTGYGGNFDDYYPVEDDDDEDETTDEYNWIKDEDHLITL